MIFAVRHFNSAQLHYFDSLEEAKYFKSSKGNRSIQYIILHENDIKEFLLSRIRQKKFNRQVRLRKRKE